MKTLQLTVDGGQTWVDLACDRFSRTFSGGEWVQLELATRADVSQFIDKMVVVRSPELQPHLFEGKFYLYRRWTYRINAARKS